MLRTLIRDHRRLALLLIACALLVKALVPQGYMIGPSTKTLTAQLCTDGSGAMISKQIEIPMERGSHDQDQSHGKTDGTCSFSSLAMAGLGTADAALLAVALAYILLLGFAPATLPFTANHNYLRPPLRGPPAAA
ncbi:DUF2946 family protein [Sphingorhabdus contaminans]|uniref:DUF2946 family protein n=1 Tax=Sphingorhabdus contaminans TaxID=1343899 RepID=UPI003D2B22C5